MGQRNLLFWSFNYRGRDRATLGIIYLSVVSGDYLGSKSSFKTAQAHRSPVAHFITNNLNLNQLKRALDLGTPQAG